LDAADALVWSGSGKRLPGMSPSIEDLAMFRISLQERGGGCPRPGHSGG
jgi:hypothetical protein